MATAAATEVRKGLPIVAYLVFGVSALVILAVGAVLLVTLSIATRNTFELLEDKSRLLLTSVVQQVRLFVEPSQAQVEALARLIETGRLEPSDPQRLFAGLQAALAASPHVRSVVFLDPSGWLMAAIRAGAVPAPEVADWRLDATNRKVVEAALARRGAEPYWGAPVYLKDPGVTVVNLRRSVIVGGEVRGVLASTITIRALSEFITGLETELGQHAFVLYDRERVLAHSALARGFPGLGVRRPLPRVTEVGDPVLSEIWHEGWQDRKLEIAGVGHWHRIGDAQYYFLYRNLRPPLDHRWLVGSYFPAEAVNVQLERLLVALGLGLLGLVAAAVAAVLLGRRVSRPIAQLANAASAIRTLDLDDLAPLRRSRLREIDQAAIAFNAMVRALRVFAAYVPKQLVQSLISRGVAVSLASQSRETTVLFTDIVAFTERTDQPQRRGDRRVPEPPPGRADRLHRGRGRHGRQVHRRCGHGALERDRRSAGSRRARRPGRARDRGRAPRRQRRARNSGPPPHGPAQRAGRGRQHRHRDAHELHGRRRHRERRPAPRGPGQGSAARRRGRDPPERGDRRRPAARTSRRPRSAGTSCAAATIRPRSSRSRSEAARRRGLRSRTSMADRDNPRRGRAGPVGCGGALRLAPVQKRTRR